MNPLPITARQIIRSVLIFVGVIVGFGVLSATVGWPSQENWGPVVLAALALAVLPLIGPLLSFLQESGAVIDIRGIKLDFSQAPRHVGAEPRRANLEEQPGVLVTDSNAASIAEAAATALDAEIIVVNLGTGRSWYPSRFFALAAAAHTLGGAKVIVLLAQRGGIDRNFIGWLPPSDVIRAMVQDKPQYKRALRRAKATLRHLQLYANDPAHVFPASLPHAHEFTTAYEDSEDLALVPALIRELQEDDSNDPETPLENPQSPSWLTCEDAGRLFDAWLIRESLPAQGDDRQTIAALARVPRRFIAVEEGGRYVGMVDIDAFARQLVLQPTKPARAA